MAEFSRPTSYLDKLRFAERVIRSAQFRPDQRQAIKELCEGMGQLVAALIDKEQGGTAQPAPEQPDKKPTP